jgi:hypothetical protein
MKQKYLTLKLYLLGLTAGLFVFGWAAITRADSASASTSAAQTTTATTTVQLQAPSLQPIPSVPRFRTRTS